MEEPAELLFSFLLVASKATTITIRASAVPIAPTIELTTAMAIAIAAANFCSKRLRCLHFGCFTECGMRRMVALA